MVNLTIRIVGIALLCSVAACATDTTDEETSQSRQEVGDDENDSNQRAPAELPKVEDQGLRPRGQLRGGLNRPIH
jgi:hypothetical protein